MNRNTTDKFPEFEDLASAKREADRLRDVEQTTMIVAWEYLNCWQDGVFARRVHHFVKRADERYQFDRIVYTAEVI